MHTTGLTEYLLAHAQNTWGTAVAEGAQEPALRSPLLPSQTTALRVRVNATCQTSMERAPKLDSRPSSSRASSPQHTSALTSPHLSPITSLDQHLHSTDRNSEAQEENWCPHLHGHMATQPLWELLLPPSPKHLHEPSKGRSGCQTTSSG